MASIEIEEFQLAPGVTAEGFLAMDASYQEHCYLHREGLQRRTTVRSESGWAVLSHWSDSPAPEDGGASAAWRTAIDEASYTRRAYATLE